MISLPKEFDDIRPYYDSEIPAAMQRIASSPMLSSVLRFIGAEEESFKNLLLSVKTTEELQKKVMFPICKDLISKTMSSFTYDGIENASPSVGRLFVSNHRDIVLDAYLQQLALVENDIPTSHITFGSNLMEPGFVVDVGLSNKMFRTERKSSDFQAFLNSSIHLSQYINYVTSHGESVWIAQRNGRTKDGYDKTEPGLLRMLLIGDDKRQSLENLNITPVSVSYQWEPCDILKAVELYRSRGGKAYVKAPGEDLHSIITGLLSPKGNVHVSMCPQVSADDYSSVIRRSDMTAVVAEMDRKIYAAYRLWDTNYVASDILNGSDEYADYYDAALKEEFIARMTKAIEAYPDCDASALREIYLRIYAGAVNPSSGRE